MSTLFYTLEVNILKNGLTKQLKNHKNKKDKDAYINYF